MSSTNNNAPRCMVYTRQFSEDEKKKAALAIVCSKKMGDLALEHLELKELHEKFDDLELRNVQLVDENHALEDKVEDLEDKLAAAETKNNDLENKLAAALQELALRDERIKTLEEANEK